MDHDVRGGGMQTGGKRLSTYLSTRSTATAGSGLVEMSQPAHAERVLLFAHPVGGSLLAYQSLVRRFPEYRCLGLEALVDGEPGSIQDLARRYVEASTDRMSEVDVVCGWSFGGGLAWEIACLLAQRGVRPKVVLLDSTWPFGGDREPAPNALLGEFVGDALRSGGQVGEWPGGSPEAAAEALGMDME